MEVPSGDVKGILSNLPDQQAFYGNHISMRATYLPSGAKKSWIEVDIPLTSGWLTEFWFNTHNISETQLGPGGSSIRLQIWRQDGNSDSLEYTLRWEYRVTDLELSSENGKAWRVSIPLSILFSLNNTV